MGRQKKLRSFNYLRSELVLGHLLATWLLLIGRVHAQQASPFEGQGYDPITADLSNATLTPVYVSAKLNKVVEVNEKTYGFEAVIEVDLSWPDPRANFTGLDLQSSEKSWPELYKERQCLLQASVNNSKEEEARKAACRRNTKTSSGGSCRKPCSTFSPDLCCDGVWLPALYIANVLAFSQDNYVQDEIFPLPTAASLSAENLSEVQFTAVARHVRTQGRFSSPLSFKQFPFDRQILQIFMVASGSNFYLMQSGVMRQVSTSIKLSNQTKQRLKSFKSDEVPGWKIANVSLDCSPSILDNLNRDVTTSAESGPVYNPNDPLSPLVNETDDGAASRTNFSGVCAFNIEVVRVSHYYIWTELFPVVVTVLLCFSVFFVPPQDVSTRLSTCVTLFLALVAVQFIIIEQVPKTSYITALGKIVITSYLIILTVTGESLLVHFITTLGDLRARKGYTASSTNVTSEMNGTAAPDNVPFVGEQEVIVNEGEEQRCEGDGISPEGDEKAPSRQTLARKISYIDAHLNVVKRARNFLNLSRAQANVLAAFVDNVCATILAIVYVCTVLVICI